jgi:cytochrome b pre-mRNA-processing protein 3
MNLISRLFRTGPDPRERLRPLWHRIVELSREPEWYEEGGVADTVPGRFDMITTVLAFVLLRLERDEHSPADTALLTELFVDDMDGQLRESGIGDVVVGKHMGRLMAALGGRIGAYRDALNATADTSLEDALKRNVTLLEGRQPAALAARLRELDAQLRDTSSEDLLAGRIER